MKCVSKYIILQKVERWTNECWSNEAKNDDMVVFYIKDQYNPPRDHYWIASNGVSIISESCPEVAIDGGNIFFYLWGGEKSKHKTELVVSSKIYEKICEAVKEFNQEGGYIEPINVDLPEDLFEL